MNTIILFAYSKQAEQEQQLNSLQTLIFKPLHLLVQF